MTSKATTGVALITGAASGIGKETAFSFAEAGAKAIVFADLNKDQADEAAAASIEFATHSDYQTLVLHVDVTDEASVQAMIDGTIEKFGRIDYFVHSAGTGSSELESVTELSIEEFNRINSVNVGGTMLCIRAASKAMVIQESTSIQTRSGTRDIGRGSIVTLGSASSVIAAPDGLPYTTSKFAVLGLTKSAAVDLRKRGVRVNLVCPSWVDTPMARADQERYPGYKEMIHAAAPLGRLAQPEEIADAIVFLSSPASSYTTGVALLIDAGLTLTVAIGKK